MLHVECDAGPCFYAKIISEGTLYIGNRGSDLAVLSMDLGGKTDT